MLKRLIIFLSLITVPYTVQAATDPAICQYASAGLFVAKPDSYVNYIMGGSNSGQGGVTWVTYNRSKKTLHNCTITYQIYKITRGERFNVKNIVFQKSVKVLKDIAPGDNRVFTDLLWNCVDSRTGKMAIDGDYVLVALAEFTNDKGEYDYLCSQEYFILTYNQY